MEAIAELPPFLTDNRPEVRLHALALLRGFTVAPPHQTFLASINVVKPLVKLISDDKKEISRVALMCLINLTESPTLRQQMFDSKVVDVIMAAFRDKKYPNHHLLGMLLSNLSTEEKGSQNIMCDGTKQQGVHLIRLLQLFVQPPVPFVPPEDEKKSFPGLDTSDTFQHLAYVIANVSRLPSARFLLTDKDRAILKQLVPMVSHSNPVRKLGVLRAIQHLCIDHVMHRYLLNEELGLLSAILLPLTGPEPLDEDDRQGMLPAVAAATKNVMKQREHNKEARMLCLKILLNLARNKPSRLYLKEKKVYFILRELHKWEISLQNQDVDDFINDVLIPYFILDEDYDPNDPNPPQPKKAAPVAGPDGSKPSISQWEAANRPARVESYWATAPAPNAADSATTPAPAPAATAENKADSSAAGPSPKPPAPAAAARPVSSSWSQWSNNPMLARTLGNLSGAPSSDSPSKPESSSSAAPAASTPAATSAPANTAESAPAPSTESASASDSSWMDML